jgi:DNA-binding XRE family transcriptional regulator
MLEHVDPGRIVIHPTPLGASADARHLLTMSYLGTRVKLLREAKRLTQEELASVARVSVTTISRYENARVAMFSGKVLERLASALDVDPGLLLVKVK